jgi:YVTN family beta-propeller protein
MNLISRVGLSFCLLCGFTASGQTVSATVAVASTPSAFAVDPSLGNLYAITGGTVSVINLASRAVVATVPVGSSPTGIAVNTSTHLVYVSNEQSNTVSIINPSSNFATTSVPVGTQPSAIAVNPINGFVYVTNFTNAITNGLVQWGVTIINPSANNSTEHVFTAEQFPNGIAIDPNNGTVYVTALGNLSCTSCATDVTAIDPITTGTTTISVGAFPLNIEVDPATDKVYVANVGSNAFSVTVITPGSSGFTTDIISLGAGGTGSGAMAIDSFSNVYMGNKTTNVNIIAAQNTVTSLNVLQGQAIASIASDNSTGLTCVVTSGGSSAPGNAVFIQGATKSIVASLPIGIAPGAVAADPARGEFYVATGGNTVTVITE